MREAVQLPDIIWRAVQAWLGACLGILLTVFLQHQRGSTSIMFALAAVPLLLSVGAAVDYVRASNLRSHLQGAVDAAALGVAEALRCR